MNRASQVKRPTAADPSVSLVRAAWARAAAMLAVVACLVQVTACNQRPPAHEARVHNQEPATPKHAPEPQVEPAPHVGAKKPDPMQKDPLAYIQQLVTAIAALPALSKPALEQLLGVQLMHVTTESGPVTYEAALPAGPFQRVELHEPSAGGVSLVLFDTRAGVELPMATFMQKKLIPVETPMQIEPNVPPEGVVTFELTEYAGQHVLYDFGGVHHMLVGIGLRRGG